MGSREDISLIDEGSCTGGGQTVSSPSAVLQQDHPGELIEIGVLAIVDPVPDGHAPAAGRLGE